MNPLPRSLLCTLSCSALKNLTSHINISTMTSDNTKEATASKSRVYISLPMKYRTALAEHYELDHGLFIKDLNIYLSEGYLQAYFREWGTITACKIKKCHSEKNKAVAYVRFSTEDEADRADWAGPHIIGGIEVGVKRVVSPKIEDSEDKMTVPAAPRPRRSMGLGYILEDAQWLDDE
ncbi:heterogeneous nuclear ribonucleoproteins A1 homolog [Toxotes jaculatrix]|uniref:heterogeneous nuclear ribonucleoproteins A1 homolog n=1 Tax=Toxotes jaculatrix TaxID=941984 RepID=UPI001B3B19F7|nr:heterogeneous nuclear ribonucleoproteins A1 homolog [Toxotes jaculatrix]